MRRSERLFDFGKPCGRYYPAGKMVTDDNVEATSLIDDLLSQLAKQRRFDPETIGLRTELPAQHPSDLILWLGRSIENLLTREKSKRIGFCDGEKL